MGVTQFFFVQGNYFFAPVAQWIEHWIPNPCAASSILAGGTNNIKGLQRKLISLFCFQLPLSPPSPHFFLLKG